MWSDSDKKDMIQQYVSQFTKYGHDIRSLLWGGKKNRQFLRFKILTEIGNLSGSSVLDVGCGFGDMYDFLKVNFKDIYYTGVDIVPDFIKIAHKEYFNVDFRVLDILNDPIKEKWDYIFVSGLFNRSLASGANKFFKEAMIRKMFEIANKGIAANFLSTYVDFRLPEASHIDPMLIFQFCKSLSKRISLRHDYMPYEFTIYAYKNDHINDRSIFSDYLINK